MMRFVVVCAVCCLPVGALAGGANPLVNGVPTSAGAGGQKYKNLLKNESGEPPPCDASGRDPSGGTNCKVIEPVLLPRDGVTDELLEKYRLKR